VTSSSSLLGIGGMLSSLCMAWIRQIAMGSVPRGHWNVPANTWSNAEVNTFASEKMSSSGGCRNGVGAAWVNLHPASSKHNFSSLALDKDSILLFGSSELGPITCVKLRHWSWAARAFLSSSHCF